MKAVGIAKLPELADLRTINTFAPAEPGDRSGAAVGRRPSVWQRIATWSRVARERRRLLELDAHILKDIGMTPEEAFLEASRPFWDVDDDR